MFTPLASPRRADIPGPPTLGCGTLPTMAVRRGAEVAARRQGDGDRVFEAFRRTGGVATGSEVARLLRDCVDQPISLLARWIVSRQVITFAWRADSLLPLFQFDFARGCVRAGVPPVLSELSGAMDDEEVALWFTQPNAWLAGGTPAGAVATNAAGVLQAARADRFIAIG